MKSKQTDFLYLPALLLQLSELSDENVIPGILKEGFKT